jgi:hypothetical protein
MATKQSVPGGWNGVATVVRRSRVPLVLIRFTTNLGRGEGGVSTGRNLNRSLGIPIIIIGVVGTP